MADLTDFVDDGADDDDPDDGTDGRPAAEARAVAGGHAPSVADVVDTDAATFPDATGTVELAVTQVDYTVEEADEEYPVVHLFGRTAGNEAEHVRVLGVEPYFYVPTADLDADGVDPVAEYTSVLDARETDANGEPFESIRGEPLTKIVTRTPRDVGRIRDDFEETYEADILFPNRFLIDYGIKGGVRVEDRRLDDGVLQVRPGHLEPTGAPPEASLRVNVFDIEVDDRRGFPEDGEEPIVCLSSYDSYRNEYIAWLYSAPDADVPAPEEVADFELIEDETATVDVRAFETEEAMLDAFIAYVTETSPDVLTGWNCLPGDSRVLMANGTEKEIRNVEIGDRVIGSEDQHTTVAEVTNKWESEKPIHEFRLADGTVLRSSGDHRVMVGGDTTVEWKRGREIDPGDYVLKPRTLHIEEPRVPTLSALVPIENQRLTDEITVKRFKENLPYGAISELEELFDVSKEVLYHPGTDIWTPERCKEAAEMYDIPTPDGGRRYRRTDVDLDRGLTGQELYLAGLVLADGTMSKSEGIRFYNTRKELHEQFPGAGSLQPDGKGCYKQNVLDYARLYAFNGLGIPFGDKNAEDIDLSRVFEMPKEYIARFLAGVIDGDGNVSSTVTVAAENRSLGAWYVKLFKRLGVYAQQRRNVVRIPDAKREISRLQDRVLPHMNHSEKVERLEDLEGGRSGQTENIPYALFEAETGSDAKRIGTDKHRRDINLKRHESESEEWTEYVFVEVEDTEIAGTETTYDIETTTHNFVTENCLVHNCEDFDIPYVLDRLERLEPGTDRNLDYNRLSRVDEVWRSSGNWGGPDIKGRVVLDLLYAYQRTQFTELESYRLDDVGEMELGVGKERYTGDIGDLWEQDPERLLEYNLRDVELCVEIDRAQEIIAFWDEVRTFVGCKLEDAPTPGDAVDMYVLHNAAGEFALPTKGQQEGEEFEGGAVFDPITGVKEMVSVLDLACFSGDTEVMTPHGVRSITDIDVGDEIYTLNPETFECEVRTVTDTHAYENTYGRLQHISGTTHDLKITENHRFLVSKKRGWNDLTPDDFTFEEYRDIAESERFAFPMHEPMSGRLPQTFSLVDEVERGYVVVYSSADLRSFRNQMPDAVTDQLELIHGSSATMGMQKKVGKYLIPVEVYREHRDVIDQHADDAYLKYAARHRETPLTFDMEDWLEFIGWYVTDGSLYSKNGTITLHQSDEDGRDAIRSLLDRMALNYSTDERGFNLSNRILHDWLEKNCGKGYANKRLPEWVFELDGSLLDVLLETMIEGDGGWSKEGLGKFWTKSDALKCDIARCAVRCGQKPTVTKQKDGTWYVSVGKRGSFNKSVNETVEEHDGMVYCVTAEDNHVVLAGRNGHFQWVGQSLYPMSMATMNASPETKVDPEEYDGETYVAPNGQHFRKTPDGMMREMIDELLSEREEKKALRDEHEPGSAAYEQYDRQQQAVKVIMNSLYGVSGWNRFRLYDKENAAAITSTGREVIEFTQKAAGELNKEVIYGDTDSVMLELGQEVTVEEAIDISFEIEEHINSRYDEFARETLNAETHRFEIEFEKLYRRFFQAGKKKRYCGHIIWKEGKDVDDIDITGFEYKRSDIAPITKEVQREVLERIVTSEGDIEELKDDLTSYLHDVIERFEAGEVGLEEIGIPGGIGKRLDNYDTDTAQVRGAKYANLLLGTNFARGSKPKRLYLDGVHADFFRRVEAEQGLDPQTEPLYKEFKQDVEAGDGVICFEYADQIPGEFNVDYEKMLEKTLKGPIARVIEALDISWEEIRSGQQQTGLGQYM